MENIAIFFFFFSLSFLLSFFVLSKCTDVYLLIWGFLMYVFTFLKIIICMYIQPELLHTMNRNYIHHVTTTQNTFLILILFYLNVQYLNYIQSCLLFHFTLTHKVSVLLHFPVQNNLSSWISRLTVESSLLRFIASNFLNYGQRLSHPSLPAAAPPTVKHSDLRVRGVPRQRVNQR